MGECQSGGGVVDWVMRAQGVSFRHAVELLRDGMPIAAPASSGTGTGVPKRSTVRTLPTPVQQNAADGELLGQVVGHYARVLTLRGICCPRWTARGRLIRSVSAMTICVG